MSDRDVTRVLTPVEDIEARLRILDLWKFWRDLQDRFGGRIKEWIELLLQLFPLPDFSLPTDARVWFRRVAGVADQVADLTSTDLDDHAAKVLHVIVESDEVWLAFYELFSAMIPSDNPTATNAVVATTISDRIGPIGDVPRIDPLLILAIAKAVAARPRVGMTR